MPGMATVCSRAPMGGRAGLNPASPTPLPISLPSIRHAQCAGEQAARDAIYQMALAIIQSQEYGQRNRDQNQYVEDLYNGLGIESDWYAYWFSMLLYWGIFTREQLLLYFVESIEFQPRVDEVVNAGT